MSLTVRISYRTRQDRDSATFNGTYQTLGSPLPKPCCIIKIVNNSTVTIDISTDGVTNQDVIPSGGFCLYDIRTNRESSDGNYSFYEGTQFYVKGSPGTGIVSLVTLGDDR